MARITVLGYNGSPDDLKRELTFGLDVKEVSVICSGKDGINVIYEKKRTGGKPPKFDKEQIKALHAAGKSYGEVAKEIGCSKTYVITVCKNQ